MEDEDYEYYEEWLDRGPELENMSLEEYNESRCIEDYGVPDDELSCGDED